MLQGYRLLLYGNEAKAAIEAEYPKYFGPPPGPPELR